MPPRQSSTQWRGEIREAGDSTHREARGVRIRNPQRTPPPNNSDEILWDFEFPDWQTSCWLPKHMQLWQTKGQRRAVVIDAALPTDGKRKSRRSSRLKGRLVWEVESKVVPLVTGAPQTGRRSLYKRLQTYVQKYTRTCSCIGRNPYSLLYFLWVENI